MHIKIDVLIPAGLPDSCRSKPIIKPHKTAQPIPSSLKGKMLFSSS